MTEPSLIPTRQVQLAECLQPVVSDVAIESFPPLGPQLAGAYASTAPAWAPNYRSVTPGIAPPDFSGAWERMHQIYADCDALVAVERCGRAVDGTYRTMRGLEMTPHVFPLDTLFEWAIVDGKTAVGIGDGGNELGMSNVASLVHQHIEKGPIIACDVPSSHCILASVSNWGGYGLAAALGVQHAADTQELVQDACIPTLVTEQRLAEALAKAGLKDGVNGLPADQSLDGLPMQVTESFLRELRGVVGLAS